MEGGLSESELNFWYVYRQKRMLPHRRFEYYMAQLASRMSQLGVMWGGTGYQIQDFLFDEVVKKPKDTVETGAQAIGAIVGGIKVIKLGQKKRRKNG